MSNYAATEEQKREKVRRYHRLIMDGMSREPAARRCGTDRQTVDRWAKMLGIPDPKRKK
jgi:transposase-like protein